MTSEENGFDDDEVDDDFDLPTTDSPSGIRPLNSYGHAILQRLAPTSGENSSVWASRLRQIIPEVQFGSPLTPALQSQIEKKMGQSIPPALLDIWVTAPGISLDYDTFLWSPQDFLTRHQLYEDILPEIFGSMVFFGVSMVSTEPSRWRRATELHTSGVTKRVLRDKVARTSPPMFRNMWLGMPPHFSRSASSTVMFRESDMRSDKSCSSTPYELRQKDQQLSPHHRRWRRVPLAFSLCGA